MASKTISLETDAYRLLKRAKRGPRDSFSQVVRRTFSHEPPIVTASDLLQAVSKNELRGLRRSGHAAG